MTIRDGEQGIQFHIDTKYSLKEFQMDCTDPAQSKLRFSFAFRVWNKHFVICLH